MPAREIVHVVAEVGLRATQREMEVDCGSPRIPSPSLPLPFHVSYQSTVPLVKDVSTRKNQSLLQFHGDHGCCYALCSC